MAQNNYLSRKKQLMRTFDKLLARVEPAVIAWLGEEQAIGSCGSRGKNMKI